MASCFYPAGAGWEAGTHLGAVTTETHIEGQLRGSISLMSVLLGFEWKPGKTHAAMVTRCKLYTERPQMGIGPGACSLWDGWANNNNRCNKPNALNLLLLWSYYYTVCFLLYRNPTSASTKGWLSDYWTQIRPSAQERALYSWVRSLNLSLGPDQLMVEWD